MKLLPLIPDGFCKIDDDLFDWASKYRWHRSPDGYVVRKTHGGDVSLHRLIAMAGHDEQVHHDNEDRLDNQRGNLKVMTLREHNRLHRSRWKGCGEIPYRGVTRAGKSYVAQIRVNGKGIYLGSFATQEEAASAWNDAAREHWGEGVYQNPVQVPYTRLTSSRWSK